MNLFTLVQIEFKKITRSKILLIFFTAVIVLWLPSVLNAHMNFNMQAEGISPENNFLIQGFLAMAWFMFPASIIISSVMLCQTERTNKGLLKMLSLPVNPRKLCLAKFLILLILAAFQILMLSGLYFAAAAIASRIQNYNFMLPPLFVFKEAALLYLSSLPIAAFYWMLSICIQTPVFSAGIGLATIVPSVFIINTKVWFLYPMSYPFYIITSEYGKLAAGLSFPEINLMPWIPAAILITVLCLIISCLRFGKAERR